MSADRSQTSTSVPRRREAGTADEAASRLRTDSPCSEWTAHRPGRRQALSARQNDRETRTIAAYSRARPEYRPNPAAHRPRERLCGDTRLTPFSLDKVTAGPAVAGSEMFGRLASVRWRAAPSSVGIGKSGGSLVGSCAPGASLIVVSRIFALAWLDH